MTPSILYLGAKGIGAACLQALIEACGDGRAELAGVVGGQPRNAALQGGIADLARAAGVPYHADWPRAPAPVDILICVQYHAVLDAAQLALARRQAVNLHMAPLPEYRGANQFTFAIINGEQEFGTTLHEMTTEVDGGPILAERRFAMAPDWTVKDLYDRTVDESVAMFRETLPDLLAGRLEGRPQASARPDAPRHFYRKRDVDDLKRLDPSWPIDKLERHVRALDMPGFEPAYFEHGGRRIYLTTRRPES